MASQEERECFPSMFRKGKILTLKQIPSNEYQRPLARQTKKVTREIPLEDTMKSESDMLRVLITTFTK